MLLPLSGFRSSPKMQQLPLQTLNFKKHIDLTKLVSWKHVTFEKPFPIIATKFLHYVRRKNGIRDSDYRAFDVHVIRAFVFLPDNLSPQLQTLCPLSEIIRTCT